MTRPPSKRHRWDHYYSCFWHCVKCGLDKTKTYDEDAIYRMPDGRNWRRFAPPCPPDEVEGRKP